MFCRLLLVTGWHFCVTVAFASRRRKSWRKQNEKKKNGFNNGMIIKICTINNKTFNQKLKEEKKKNPRHVAHAFIVGLRWHFQRCVCTIKKEKFIDSIRFIYGLEFLFLFFIQLRKWWNVKCIVVLKLQSHEKNVKRSLMDRHDLMVKKNRIKHKKVSNRHEVKASTMTQLPRDQIYRMKTKNQFYRSHSVPLYQEKWYHSCTL